MKCALTAALLLLSGALVPAAEGGPMLQFNDQHFAPEHAYAFQMKTPDLDAMSPQDMQGGPEKMKWKKSTVLVLSDKPFDAAALAKLDPPVDALDRMVAAGAVMLTVIAGVGGKVDMLQLALPRSQTALQLDTGVATLTLDPPKDGKLSGRLVVKGDRKMHDFDPQNVPFVEADVRFVTAAPAH